MWGALARVVDAFKLDLVFNSRRVDLAEAQHVTQGRWAMRLYRVHSQLGSDCMAACLRGTGATATVNESVQEVGLPGTKDPGVEDGKPDVMADGASPKRDTAWQHAWGCGAGVTPRFRCTLPQCHARVPQGLCACGSRRVRASCYVCVYRHA